MPNPFTDKAKKKPNPFSSKAKKKSTNPFTAKARVVKDNSKELAELDARIEAARQAYEESLEAALKGITKAQTAKRFDISDRHMRTLLAYSSQRKHLLGVNNNANGTEVKKLWASPSRKSKAVQRSKAKPSPTRVKPKSSPPPVSKKAKRTQQGTGTALRIKARRSTRT